MTARGDEFSGELARFARLVSQSSASDGSLPGFFDATRELTIARAPGRLDVMGGIADYSGSLVLELPIREGAFAAAQRADDGVVRIASIPPNGDGSARALVIPAPELRSGYAAARAFFSSSSELGWGAYVAGVLVALAELGSAFRGARLL